VVIGADGFGFAKDGERWEKIEQLGAVRIGNDVEIGANTCIDRGALQDTVIEDGVKLDNLIQIGHNVRVGRNTAMAGCVGVAGSATIGAAGGQLSGTDGVRLSVPAGALGNDLTLRIARDTTGMNPALAAALPDADMLIHWADIAMYHAKKNGRDRHAWFEPQMESEIRFRNALETGLRRQRMRRCHDSLRGDDIASRFLGREVESLGVEQIDL